MEQSLLKQLETYNQTDFYPFHMPGHKRNADIDYIPAAIDITEIEGFDNLHHAEGILKEAQERAAKLYGAEESYFLVNGSTSGILAAIGAAVPYGETIIMARNCHKAAYHGAFLRNLQVKYVYPEVIEPYGIYGGINPKQIKEYLENYPYARAVFITSPTYEGMVSNIEEIADIVHSSGKILIVDEAHGAHLGLHKNFPDGAIVGHADLVIQSLHKTLPSMTQTAILHVQGSRVDRLRLRKYLQIYQTSSPSYVFMAGMDSCIRLMESQGLELFEEYRLRLDWFYEEVKHLRYLKVLLPQNVRGLWNVQAMDPSKICIFITGEDCVTTTKKQNGTWLYHKLLEDYHLQMEMAAGKYVLAMTSVMDTEEGFKRLAKALIEIDEELASFVETSDCAELHKDKICKFEAVWQMLKKHVAEVVLTAAQVEDAESEVIELNNCIGKISKEYRYVYPPGVPVLVPGERITKEVLKLLKYYQEADLNVLGQQYGLEVIEVVKS